MKILWRRKWQPIPVFLLGESHGQRSLVGYSPWGGKKLDMSEHTPTFLCLSIILLLIDCIIVLFWAAVSQFRSSVVSDSLWPHGLQHTRLPCPSPTPRAYSNSCPSCYWCHSAISSSVVPLSSCLQSFPASGSFQWVGSSHQVAKVLEFQLQRQSFQWIFRTDFL